MVYAESRLLQNVLISTYMYMYMTCMLIHKPVAWQPPNYLYIHVHDVYTCVFNLAALIESGYHPDNCYHNCTHAADVAQALHCLLMEPKVETLILDHGRDTVPYFKGGCLMLCLTINTVCVCLAAVVQTHDSTGAAGSLHCCPLS